MHPCKHASVMKKVIERMNSSVVAEQLAQQKKEGRKKWFGRKSGGSGSGGASGKDASGGKDTSGGGASGGGAGGEEEDVEGMRVDFYLVVFLKFIASIVPTIEVDSTTSF